MGFGVYRCSSMFHGGTLHLIGWLVLSWHRGPRASLFLLVHQNLLRPFSGKWNKILFSLLIINGSLEIFHFVPYCFIIINGSSSKIHFVLSFIIRYIAPEQVPVQYGGLSREGEQEFNVADSATEVIIKPTSKHTVEFSLSEVGIYTY